MSLFEQSLAIVDLETTGGDPRVDRITEIGVVLIDGMTRREWSSLVNPGVSIPSNIQRFIGITDAMVADAPRFADLAGELAALLQGRLFIAHNARFDHGFLRNEFARLGVSFSPQVMCSVKLSRALYPGFPRHGLDALMERFGLGCDARHRALGDARVVRDFLDIVQRDFDPLRIEQAMQKAGRISAAPPGMMPGALDDIPDAPGVYVFYGDPPPATDLVPAESGLPLYVGKSRNLRARVLSHFSGVPKGGQAARMLRETRRVDWVETAGELGALLLEARLLKQLQPVYNKSSRPAGPAVAIALRGGPGSEVPAGELALTIVDSSGVRVVHAVLDLVTVGDQFVHRRLAGHRPRNGQFGRLVVGAIEVFHVEVGILDGIRVQPHEVDDDQFVYQILRNDAFRHAVDDRVGGGRLDDAAEQFDGTRILDGHLGHHHRGRFGHLVAVAHGEHAGVAGGLAHHLGKGLADRTVDRADDDFRHGVGELAFLGEDGGFTDLHHDALGHLSSFSSVCGYGTSPAG
jgi:DNA polymerase III epsilon subunit family exonuclease